MEIKDQSNRTLEILRRMLRVMHINIYNAEQGSETEVAINQFLEDITNELNSRPDYTGEINVQD